MLSLIMSMIAFVLFAVVAVGVLAALTGMELGFKMPRLKPSGDSSLGPNSINWMGGIAFATAAYICFVLI